MKIKDLVYGTIKYSIIFSLGYYIGGGCENSNVSKAKRVDNNFGIEKNIGNYDSRLNNLERRLQVLEDDTR